MNFQRIALTRDRVEALLMHALLMESGLHPIPPSTSLDVLCLGGENGHHVEVPETEVRQAVDTLRSHSFDKCLIMQ